MESNRTERFAAGYLEANEDVQKKLFDRIAIFETINTVKLLCHTINPYHSPDTKCEK